jgi:hypothetical protein
MTHTRASLLSQARLPIPPQGLGSIIAGAGGRDNTGA